ncbi:MAG: hypothetical protein AAGF95_08825 [Chloroflexota bacterium]
MADPGSSGCWQNLSFSDLATSPVPVGDPLSSVTGPSIRGVV